ncbi:MAG: GntR family transcriptional regulator [Rhizobacter sp.]|nr:GntR family transcriptional regulator [Rhizobacter sp.]
MATPATPLFHPIAPEASGMPLYRVAKRALLQAIETGACLPGDTLPSESELSAAFGISIGTLRKAVDELVAEHILVRRQGRGTFVATHDADRFLFQFFHIERSDGLHEAPTLDLLSYERQRADEDAAAALRLRVGDPVIQIENRLLLQGQAVIHDRLTLPAALFKGLSEKRFRDRPGTIYQLYQSDFGITVTGAIERARAGVADRSASRVLGLAHGLAVMQVRRTALTFGDRPVEYRVSVIDTTRHDYVHLLSRPAGRKEWAA